MPLIVRPAPRQLLQAAPSACLVSSRILPLQSVIPFALLASFPMDPQDHAIPATHLAKIAQALSQLIARPVLQLLQFCQEVFAFLVSLASTTTQVLSSAKPAVPSVLPAQEELLFALPAYQASLSPLPSASAPTLFPSMESPATALISLLI